MSPPCWTSPHPNSYLTCNFLIWGSVLYLPMEMCHGYPIYWHCEAPLIVIFICLTEGENASFYICNYFHSKVFSRIMQDEWTMLKWFGNSVEYLSSDHPNEPVQCSSILILFFLKQVLNIKLPILVING